MTAKYITFARKFIYAYRWNWVDMGLLDPTTESEMGERKPLAPRIDMLEGNCIGFLRNGKLPAPPIFDTIQSRLEDKYSDISFVHGGVDELNRLKDDEVLNEIEEWARGEPDAVISAYGDCGSCTKFQSWATNRVEDAGIPTVGLLDEGFVMDWERNAIEWGRPLRYKSTPVRCEITDRERIENLLSDDLIVEVEDELTRPLTDEERVRHD